MNYNVISIVYMTVFHADFIYYLCYSQAPTTADFIVILITNKNNIVSH